MTVTYTIQPQPRWYIPNNLGLPATGGYIFTYRSLNKNEFKTAYQDPAGAIPWTNPIPIDANGTELPIYWKFDSAAPNELYYIRVCNSNDPDDLLWDFDGIPTLTGGGGGTITTVYNLTNYVANNVMWENDGNSASPLPAFLVIAPGAHQGLAKTDSLYGPDITFVKTNTTATDQIQFVNFTLGDTPFAPDITPVQYCRYLCTNTPSGETYKYFQFPITSKVQNLSGTDVIFTLWARLHSGTGGTTLRSQLTQFYGDGLKPITAVTTVIQDTVLTSAWTKIEATFSIPDVSAHSADLNDCGNDGLFIQLQMPLNTACDIDFTKPSIFIGDVAPEQEYATYDQINGVVNSPRTGELMISYIPFASTPKGYVYMNDGTIGSAGSGATNRANLDVFPLYNLLWNAVSQPSANAYAPVTGGLGTSAAADFANNKPMTLTKQLGRVIAAYGQGSGLSNWALGQTTGVETHTIGLNEIPDHTHNPAAGNFMMDSPGNWTRPAPNGQMTDADKTAGITGYGGQTALSLIQPTVFAAIYIKL